MPSKLSKAQVNLVKAFFSATFLLGSDLRAGCSCGPEDYTCFCDIGDGMTLPKILQTLDQFFKSQK